MRQTTKRRGLIEMSKIFEYQSRFDWIEFEQIIFFPVASMDGKEWSGLRWPNFVADMLEENNESARNTYIRGDEIISVHIERRAWPRDE